METRLQRRQTRRYREAYSHLDQWEQIGTAEIIRSTKTKIASDGNRHAYLSLIKVKAEPDATPVEIADAILDTYQQECRCEHDCCGHMFGGARHAKHLRGDLYAVKMSFHRNV